MQFESRGRAEDLEISWEKGNWVKLLEATHLPHDVSHALCGWVASQWSRMPNAVASRVELPQRFCEPVGDEVVFYPGSFNPWHLGHNACIELTPLRPLIVVPDRNPWKESGERTNPWRELLELAEKLPNDVSLYPGFFSLDHVNPTIDWLPYVNWQRKGLTIGADNFLVLDRWKEYERLLRIIDRLYVAPRLAADEEMLQAKTAYEKINPKLEISILPHHQYEELASRNLK